MTAFLVTYRLGRNEQDYPGLYKYFDETGYAIVGTSSRVIISHKTIEEVYSDLAAHTDANDMLYVIRVVWKLDRFAGTEWGVCCAVVAD